MGIESRKYLYHTIETKGIFSIKSLDGSFIEIFGQCHALNCTIEEWDEDSEEWDETEWEVLDVFYLTGDGKGYKYTVDDLHKFYDIENLEYESNGISSDWSGIESEDSIEEAKSKWYYYKAGFPSIKSKDQFVLH